MRRIVPLALLAAAGATLLVGCDEDVVFRTRPIFDQPIEAALGFLGYGEESSDLTVCGNCHIGQQSEWELTGHADAWATLEASGHARDSCRGCHSTNSLGNTLDGQVGGWFADPTERYHDVQCESCHGAGLAHVQNPDASQPLARLAVDVVLDGQGGVESATACGECHTGTHHHFVEEWALSPHATTVASAAGRAGCQGCHSGEGALRAWGIDADYVEKDQFEGSETDNLPITCGVCHDPHGSENGHQLRFPVETTSIEEHLCAQCHNRRTAPDPNSSHGLEPHSPESALLVGDAGHFFPGTNVNQGQILGSHGSEVNAKLCATCHVNSLTVTDEATGDFVLNATGHTFNAIPCVDAQGRPLPGEVECAVTASARSFDGCTASGCHGTEQVAASAIRTAALRINTLAEDLEGQLLAVDPNLTDAGGEIDGRNPTFTVAEGAFFNLELARFGGDIEGAAGSGIEVWGSAVHNPFLVESLLLTSIQEVERAYGVSPNLAPAQLRSMLTPPPARTR